MAGSRAPVALWDVGLWFSALSLAWGCLLFGSMGANRFVLLLSILLFLYFNGVMATSLPRSAWNGILPLPALAAVWMGERSMQKRRASAPLPRILFCAAAGAMIGIASTALTPLAKLFTNVVLWAGVTWGTVLGLLLYLAAARAGRRTPQAAPAGDGVDAPSRETRRLALLSFPLIVYYGSIAARGGWGAAAGQVVSFVTLWSGYLWPVYYFIGAGAVLKAIGRAGDVAGTLRGIFTDRFFALLAAAALLSIAAIVWLPAVLDAPAFPWPAWLARTAEFVYQKTATLIWEDPLRGTAWEWFRWVLLFDVAAFLWLAAFRRFDVRAAGALLIGTLAAGFLIWEYIYQLGGFARTQNHSALVLGLYSVGLLWMVHRTGLKFAANPVHPWPAAGRFGIYGGLLLFVLLSLHVRAAIHDTRLLSELFLYFFSGLVGIGIPYYMYVSTSRSLGQLPVSLPRLVGMFGLGIVLTMPAAAMDKLVVAGGSFAALRQYLASVEKLMLEEGKITSVAPPLPSWWVGARGILVFALLFAAARLVARREDRCAKGTAFMLFLVSAAMGFASFSGMQVDLPLLPLKLSILFAPYRRLLTMDLDKVASYLAWGLPAVTLAFALSKPGAAWKRALLVLVSIGLHLCVALAWPAREAWVRSSDLLWTGGLGLLLLFVVLIRAARSRVRDMTAAAAAGEGQGETRKAPPEPHCGFWRSRRSSCSHVRRLYRPTATGAWIVRSPRSGVRSPYRPHGRPRRLRRPSAPAKGLLPAAEAAPDH